MEQKAKQIASLLKVLSNENRLLLLCALTDEEMTVGALGVRVPAISQSALSQHLALLKAHGIVSDSRRGQHVFYSIADRRVLEVINVLKVYYCQPDASV